MTKEVDTPQPNQGYAKVARNIKEIDTDNDGIISTGEVKAYLQKSSNPNEKFSMGYQLEESILLELKKDTPDIYKFGPEERNKKIVSWIKDNWTKDSLAPNITYDGEDNEYSHEELGALATAVLNFAKSKADDGPQK